MPFPFLTVNISLVVTATESTEKLGEVNLICWPSFNKWFEPVVTTPGLATEIDEGEILVVVDTLSKVPVAPEVPPVIFSAVVNVDPPVVLRWVNILISNK